MRLTGAAVPDIFGEVSHQTNALRRLFLGRSSSRRFPKQLLYIGAVLALTSAASRLDAQSTFVIQSASPSFIGAGANGATLVLNGNLTGLSSSGSQVCFYNGSSTSTPITPTIANNLVSIAVPASTIQNVPAANFTAANGYSVAGQIYVASQGATTCDGTFDNTLTNSLPEPIAEPLLGTYLGPANIPQTNSATNLQAPPVNIVISGSNFTADTTVTLGSFGAVTAKVLSAAALSIAVPAALSSSAVGTTASVTLCNGTAYCSGAASTLTLTVSALVPSAGTLTITPTPVTLAGTTTLVAQYKRDPQNGATLPEPGAPSGIVTFTAAGTAVGTAPLTLDKTALFVPVTTTTTIPATATPVIAPPAGAYIGSRTITITDSAAGAAIYYTTDASTPTTASTLYTGPFSINASGTINAIALASGFRPSAVASNAYTITVLPASGLAFVTQPVTAATGVTIAPPVQVAVVDVDGNTVTTSTAPVTLVLATNPGQGNLAGTLTENAVNGIATFADLSIIPIANGYTLTASSGNLAHATSTAFNITPYPISVTLFAPLIGVTSTLPGTFTLSHPAPTGGVTVSLASSDTTLVTVAPATVTIAAGQTTGSFTYTGVQPTSTVPPANNNLGIATITASAPNYLAGSASTTETYSLVSLGTIPPVAPAQVLDLATSLATNAPAGGVTIYFTSSDPTVATITPSVFVPAGQRTASANPQITGVKIGTTNVVATAQGYAPDFRAVKVTVVATFSTGYTSINLTTSKLVTLGISAPAQTGGITFALSSDDTSKVTVPSSVTIPAGQTSVVVPITGVANSNGYIAVRADSAGVTEAVLNVIVNGALQISNLTTGAKLEDYTPIYIPTTSPTPVTITVTVADTSIATISATQTAIGQKTLTFTNITNPQNLYIYVQGKSIGATTVTASGPGYTNGVGTLTIEGAGFVFNGYYLGGEATTTFSAPTSFSVYPAIVDPATGNYVTTSTIAPGVGTITLPISSSTPATGTLQASLAFNPGDTSQTAVFTPLAAGTTTLSLGPAPAGFSTPATYKSFLETVTAPTLNLQAVTTGIHLEDRTYAYTNQNPTNPVTVTVKSNDATIALLSTDPTVVGTATLTFTNISNIGAIPYIYVQGLKVGSTTLAISAPGFTGTTAQVTVDQAGFVFNGYYSNGETTTTFSDPTMYTFYPVIIDPTSLNYVNISTFAPGSGTLNVALTSSVPGVGTVSSPVVFSPGDTQHNTTFTPVAAGTTTLAITTPTGYKPSNQYQSFIQTVTAPSLNIANVITGVNMQVQSYVNTNQNPPAGHPVTVTVTSSGPAIAVISSDGTVVGGTTLTFTNVSNIGSLPYIYVQGKSVGTATLTASAPGYTTGTSTASVYPSGFTFSNYANISTTTFSSPTSFDVYPSILNPATSSSPLSFYTFGTLSPGVAPVTVAVTSSDSVVGTVATSPVVFNAGDTAKTLTFQPTSAGSTVIAIAATPAGYSTPANDTTFPATVTAPALSWNIPNLITGAGLTSANNVYLPVAPPNPITVTIISNGPALATISKNGTVVGGTTLTFTNVTAAGYLPNIYVQGQTTGSTTITASAPGYTNAVGNVTVYPSGFAMSTNPSFTGTVAQGARNISVYPWALNPGTLTLYTNLAINPGTAPSVTVTSSNTAVGTISNVPLVFNPGDTSHYFTFTPVAPGTSTITVGNPNPAVFSNPSQGQTATATIQ